MANCNPSVTNITNVNRVNESGAIISGLSLTGLTASNTDSCKLHCVIYWPTPTISKRIVIFYKSYTEAQSQRSAAGGGHGWINANSNAAIWSSQWWTNYNNGGLSAVITPNVVAASDVGSGILQSYNGSGITGSIQSISRSWAPISQVITFFFNAPITTTTTTRPTTTTTTTYPGTITTTTIPPVTTTTTTPTVTTVVIPVVPSIPTVPPAAPQPQVGEAAPTTTTTPTTPTSTTTSTTTPLLNAQTIRYLNASQTEIVTHRYGALNYGTVAPGETSKTIIVSLFAPYIKQLNHINISLADTGGIDFSANVFGVTTSDTIDPSITPESSFMGVNNSDAPDNFNFAVPNRNSNTSAYVYLNVRLPRDNFLGSGTIRYKWFFDYSD